MHLHQIKHAFTSILNCFQYYYFSIFGTRNYFPTTTVRPISLSRWQRFSFPLVFLALAVRAVIWLLICARHYYGRSRSFEFPKMKRLPIDNDQNVYTFFFLNFHGTYRERWITVKEAKDVSNRTGHVLRFCNIPSCSANDGSYHTYWIVGADGNFVEKWLTATEATALAKEALLRVLGGDRVARAADNSPEMRPAKKSSLPQTTRQPLRRPPLPPPSPIIDPPGRMDIPPNRIRPCVYVPVFDPVNETAKIAFHFKRNVCICMTSWVSAEKTNFGLTWCIMIRACTCGTRSLFRVQYRSARG